MDLGRIFTSLFLILTLTIPSQAIANQCDLNDISVAADLRDRGSSLSKEVEAIVRLSSQMTSEQRNNNIWDFAHRHMEKLSVQDIELLIKGSSQQNFKNGLVRDYCEVHGPRRLSASDLIKISKMATTETRNNALWSYTQYRSHNTTVKWIINIATAAATTNYRNGILKQYMEKNRRKLNTDSAIELAKSAADGETKNTILWDFVQAHKGRLSANDVERLAQNAANQNYKDAILKTYQP